MQNLLFGKQNLLFSLFAIAGLATASPSMASSLYKITDLGTLSPNGTSTQANAINNQGQVVGRSQIAPGVSHGFIWEQGVMTELPYSGLKNGTDFITLPGRGGLSRSINESGYIVGAGDELPGATDRALLWSPTANGYELAINDFGGIESYFIDINNENEIAGYHIYAAGKRNAIFSLNNNRINLPGLGGDQNYGLAINDQTEIVGYVDIDGADNGTNTYSAAIWQKDANGDFVLTDIGLLGATQTFAREININSQVVGQRSGLNGNSSHSSAFLWENNNWIDLGHLGGNVGNALSINKHTQVVGTSNTVSNVAHAFLWENNQMFDLNNLLVNGTGWQLTQATGINDKGQIVGYGLYTGPNGQTQTRAFILQAVPESDTVAGVLGVGLFGLVQLRRRKN